jgi:hypothetical protein
MPVPRISYGTAVGRDQLGRSAGLPVAASASRIA